MKGQAWAVGGGSFTGKGSRWSQDDPTGNSSAVQEFMSHKVKTQGLGDDSVGKSTCYGVTRI